MAKHPRDFETQTTLFTYTSSMDAAAPAILHTVPWSYRYLVLERAYTERCAELRWERLRSAVATVLFLAAAVVLWVLAVGRCAA